jgi:hypothetical protein
VKAFLKCPAFYTFKYVRGEAPAFVPVTLAFGTAIHAGLAAYYLQIKTAGEPLPRDLLLDAFRAAWADAADGPVPLQLDEEDESSFDQLTDKGVSMLHAFYEHAATQNGFEVESVERSFAVTVRDPNTGEALEEQLIGTIDLLVREGSRRVVVEHKTAAKRYGVDQLRWDLQPTAYRLGCRGAGLGDVGLRYQVLTKTKVPAIQLADVSRDEQDEFDFLRTVIGVLRAVEAGVDHPVPGWACRSCPYAYTCR